MIVVLLVIPAVLIAVSLLPARKQSTEIVSGVYIESSDEHTDAFLSYLTSTSTGFTFSHYESLKDMKDDVASGRIDSAYMVPDGFSESMIHSDGKRHITVYTTDGSSFQSVSEESVYAALLYAYAADMSVCMLQDRYLANVPYDETQMSEYISDRFKGYIENEDIFTIESGLTGKYTASTDIAPNNFPVEILVYITLFVCSLLGLQNYLRDLNCGAYSILSSRKKAGFCVKNIAAGIIPAAIISFISLIIYSGTNGCLNVLLHIAAVSVISLAAALIFRVIFRRYKIFTIALPFIIICTLLLSLLSMLSQM